MNKPKTADRVADVAPDFLGGGDMAELIRTKDWTNNPLGPPERWPQSLKTTVSILLNSRYPMFIFWGDEQIKIYNDSYRPITGDKHPWALGRPGAEVWPEIWDTIGPMVERVVRQGEATWSDDLMLFMQRYGFPEEVFFTFSYSPVHDETGGIGGMFCACTETTTKVLGERRLHTLRDLAAIPARVRALSEVCELSAQVLACNPADVPFALIYLIDGDNGSATLTASTGVANGHPAAPALVVADAAANGGWPLLRVAASAEPEWVDDLVERFGEVPPGPWPEPPTSAVVLPLMDQAQERPSGLLVLGASARRPLDDDYRGFFQLVAAQVAASIANAHASEEERRRAEMLAQLDRAKTAFFSNVSHELRTPLTLLMGPVEEALSDDTVTEPLRQGLSMAHRNSQRLLKLVNSLLDFSRLEAGRLEATYEPVQLGETTRDLASVFRAAVEKAGLRLIVDCIEPPQPVYVDRDMWEKIVLNLLSNAFKHTFAGEIRVALRAEGDSAVLTLTDTGTGIPQEALPHLFERFYRVPNARGRTHEGAGIGLALVHELVQLHGGSVRVQSELDRGSTFTISVPFGTAHLRQQRVLAPAHAVGQAPVAAAFVEEALRWLPAAGDMRLIPRDAANNAATPVPADAAKERILLADGNADMRAYVQRLLADEYEVTTVADGHQALKAIAEQQPDLVLTDVMMPTLDGFGLLQALRAGPHTAAIPVILLSTRAGEEARLEGLQAKADGYLTKPFSSRELLVRVQTTLALARIRRDAEARVSGVLESVTDGFVTIDREWRYTSLNSEAERLLKRSRADLLGKRLWDEFPALDGTNVAAQLRAAAASQSVREFESFYRDWQRWYEYKAYPMPGGGLAVYFRDITGRKQAESALRFQGAVLRQVNDAVIAIDNEHRITYMNHAAERAYRVSAEEMRGRPLRDVYEYRWLSAEDKAAAYETLHRTGFWRGENVNVRSDGTALYVEVMLSLLKDDLGKPAGKLVVIRDISARRAAEAAVHSSEERFRQLADAMPQIVWTARPDGSLTFVNRQWQVCTGLTLDQTNDFRVAREVLHPDDLRRVTERWSDSLATGSPHEVQWRLRRREDGAWRWFLTRALPVRDADGCIREWFGTATDIHEQKLVEERLRESEERFAMAFNSTPLVLSLLSLETGKLVEVNDSFVNLFGYRREEVIGRTGAELGLWANVEDRTQELTEVRRSGRVRDAEYRFRTRSGEEIIGLLSAERVDIGGKPHALTVVQDITERKHIEDALRESEERFRHMADSAPGMVWVADTGGSCTYLSKAWYEFTGQTPETGLGRGWFAAVHPEDRAEAKRRLSAAGERQEPFGVEYRVRRRDGEWRWGINAAAPRFSPEGRFLGYVGSVFDITERKEAEKRLRASEARLASKLEMMNRLHALSTQLLRAPDVTTVLQEVLDAALMLLETDMGSVQLLNPQTGKLEIAVHRGLGPEVLDYFREVGLGGGSACAQAMEKRERIVLADVAKDAEFAPHCAIAETAGFRAVQSTPLLSRQGELFGVLSTYFPQPRELQAIELRMLDLYARHAVDFLERFRIEAALRESEERLRFALRSANAGVWRWNVATDEMYWSEEFGPLYGYDATTPRHYDAWLESVHPADRAHVHAKFISRSKLEQTEFQQEFRIIHPQRGVRWILDLGRIEKDSHGRCVGFSGIHLDITERKQAEEALRNSERLYRAIGESIDYGVWLCDPEGRNIYVSESFLRLVGLTQAQCSEYGWGTVLHPDDAERTMAAWKECVRTGGQWDIEHRFRGIDGKWHHILARGVPVRNESGEITAWAGINLDINRQKQVEDELREAHYRKDEFLATLAHELRNPLAPLRNGLEILRLAKDNREAAERARGMMERQLQQMVRLIDDLLDLSRISRGKVELRKERVDLAVVMQQAVETSRPLIEQSGHELAIGVPREPVYVHADVTRLAQVVSNLLNNAAKYTDKGGRIALTLERRRNRAAITVKDNGRGIPAHMLPRVFEMFTQVEGPHESTNGGLGIGLSIVRRLVDMHGGTVEVSSDGPGMGSAFTVQLPVAMKFVEPVPGPSEALPAPAAGERRVLVADDNADAASSLATLLKIMGNDVRTARDGQEAVEIAQLFQPELILLDIGMPKMDGYEACQRIREQPWGREVVIAALTGWGQEEDKRRSRDAGFDRHLVKPIEPAALEKLLTRPRAENA